MNREDEIRERLNKATQGNWCHIPNIKKGRSIFSNPDTRLKIGEAHSYDDAVFICCASDDIKYLLEQITAMQEENAALKSDLLDGSKTGYEVMRREITTLKDYSHALKVANDTTYENYKKLEQHNAALTKALKIKNRAYRLACEDNHDNRLGATSITKIEKALATLQMEDYFIQQARSAINSKEGEE
jgi:hypothetical protein